MSKSYEQHKKYTNDCALQDFEELSDSKKNKWYLMDERRKIQGMENYIMFVNNYRGCIAVEKFSELSDKRQEFFINGNKNYPWCDHCGCGGHKSHIIFEMALLCQKCSYLERLSYICEDCSKKECPRNFQ